MSAFHRALLEILAGGEDCATATLVDHTGSTPGKQGHRMIVRKDGSILFTIGGGPLEASVIADCLERLESGRNGVHEYRLVESGRDAVGMVCGGTARVFIEIHAAEGTLLVFGAGHVGREVIDMARGLELRRIIADDRREQLDPSTFDADVRTVLCPDGYSGDLPPVDSRTHVVIVTRCHATDREILARVAATEPAYLGMIGSRRKVEQVLAELSRRGLPRQRLEHLHAPIGLDIGARSPREIAVAILAEIVATRAARRTPARRPVPTP